MRQVKTLFLFWVPTVLSALLAAIFIGGAITGQHEQAPKTYCTILECSDGAFRPAAEKHLITQCNVANCDAIARPGIVKTLAENTDQAALKIIREDLEFLVKGHQGKIVGLMAHEGCLADPEIKTKAQAAARLAKAKQTVEGFNIKGVEKIVKLWVDKNHKATEIP